MKVILFSRDRAMQVDATLCSFYLHCQDIQLADIHVLYRASTPGYEAQYRLLEQTYPQVSFVSEKNFREDVEGILLSCYERVSQRRWYRFVSKINRLLLFDNSFIAKIARRLARLGIKIGFLPLPFPSKESFIFFMVDDNLFVRPFSLRAAVQALHAVPDAIGFSLRLGRNATYTYSLNNNQELPIFEEIAGGVLVFDWRSAQYDFNYPLEVSSSIYRAMQILPLLGSIAFRNPNTLEGEMAARSRWYANRFPKLLCFDTSVAFCNPVNKVQTIAAGNRAGLTHQYTVEELARRFDKGERVDVNSYSGFMSNACHQEVELIFTSQK